VNESPLPAELKSPAVSGSVQVASGLLVVSEPSSPMHEPTTTSFALRVATVPPVQLVLVDVALAVISTGALVATPVNEIAEIPRLTDDAESVAVITVEAARPLGACADTRALLMLPFLICLSIDHVRLPPLTLESVPAATNQSTCITMNPPLATALAVVSAIVVAAGFEWLLPSC
jgi:hypothetical protein